jgi:acetate kinase
MDGRSILAVNSGSSSIKFALFTLAPEPEPLSRGELDADARQTAAVELMNRISTDVSRAPLAAIGHRIVHGGPDYYQPSVITTAVVRALEAVVPFAPNHLPDEIALIKALQRSKPELTQFACFDTGFHHHLPDVAQRLPIPLTLASSGIRRYGFHGLSYAFLTRELERLGGPAAANGRVVLAHLGSGSSLAALHHGKSVDTTMGLTPLGGVVMSTRPGDLDPGVLIHVLQTMKPTTDQLEEMFSTQSGLLGISNRTADMRELLAQESTDAGCRLAVKSYCYEIRKRIGSYAAALGGLETLVFAGGIGEHAPAVRARVCDGLAFLGVQIDEPSNAANAPIISTADARVTVRVIPTDEEKMIAYAAHTLLG